MKSVLLAVVLLLGFVVNCHGQYALIPAYPVMPVYEPYCYVPPENYCYIPMYYYTPPVYYYNVPRVWVHPKVYVEGQPVRNILRAVTP
jgi:hypothetical protein